jgi:serine-type D-Ala-D-Ala carboxypeptidase (penicillin-binding protein 5/6)
MNRTPLIDPRSHRRREHARRRRRQLHRERVAAAGLVLVLLVLGAVTARSVLSAGRRSGGSGATAAAPAPPARPRLSPLGLPLGPPPLHLTRAGAPAVNPGFATSPRGGVLVDLNDGRVLWSHDADVRMPVASLTKMMTALLAVEHTAPDAQVLVTREAVNQQGSKVGLLPRGRRVPVHALLAGLLLPSGNDAAVALAQDVGGTVGDFVRLMNERAAQLGMGCTRFAFPSGFVDTNNYSCAADLAQLADVDIGQPRIESLSRQASVALPFPIRGGKLFVANNNPLVLEHYPGITGLKTGWTVAAGECLVATAERHGVRLVAVLLHSPNLAVQARVLLDDGFAALHA